MSDKARSELAPTGVLRAGINLSNFLLVTGRTEKSEPVGVAPDMAREIANKLGVPVTYVPFKTPGELADQAGKNVWDIGLIGAEPQRAEKIAFTAAYVEIEATYMVPAGSPITSIADVDRKGVRIAVSARSAPEPVIVPTSPRMSCVTASTAAILPGSIRLRWKMRAAPMLGASSVAACSARRNCSTSRRGTSSSTSSSTNAKARRCPSARCVMPPMLP